MTDSESKSETITAEVELDEKSVLINKHGEFHYVPDVVADELRYPKEKLEGMKTIELLANPKLQHGKDHRDAMKGQFETTENKLIRGDGSIVIKEMNAEPVEIDGETFIKCTGNVIKEVRPPTDRWEGEESIDNQLAELDADEIREVAKNVRIQSPDGEISLAEVMLDLAAAHNELEQLKTSAISIHEAVDERLQEEQLHNPDSDACAVLEEVSKTARGLFLRVHRGDQELHGNREGKYSGYYE